MPGCCDGDGYEEVFSDRFAQRVVRRYRRRGLTPVQARMVDFLCERGIEGASVLEIGGGVGEIQLELLRRGAARVTNLEISTSYEELARQLLDSSGLADRVDRRLLDIAREPDEVEAADVVLLHRVVCCYPDYEALLGAAGRHARRLLVFSHPPENAFSRTVFGAENLLRRLRGRPFRSFVHPEGAMESALVATGLEPTYEHRGPAWRVVGLERVPVGAAPPV